MDVSLLTQGIELIEKFNASAEPELFTAADARKVLALFVKIERQGSFGVAAFSRKVTDAETLARLTGTSVGKAKETVATGKVLGESPELNIAMQHGEVSLDQAAEIARAEEAAPGCAEKLRAVAKEGSFAVLKEKARARPISTRI